MSEQTPAGSAGRDGAVYGDGGAIVWDLVRGVWRFAALHALIDLGCADHLAAGPLTVTELAERCGAHAPSLARVLRSMASAGLLATVAPGTYALTPAGASLHTNPLPRTAVPFCAEAACWVAMRELPETVRTGKPAFIEQYGGLYRYLAGNQASARLFTEFMAARSRPLAAEVAQARDFTGDQLVLDVGGGNGTFLAAILKANPHLRGALLELGHSLPAARELLDAEGLAERCELVEGDFFASVPAGADTYLLTNVVHNWDDDDALRILRSVRAAAKDQGRLLLVDAILPGDDRPHLGKDLDIRMLSLFGEGRERSEAEYFALLGEAGFRPADVTGLSTGMSLVEARPV